MNQGIEQALKEYQDFKTELDQLKASFTDVTLPATSPADHVYTDADARRIATIRRRFEQVKTIREALSSKHGAPEFYRGGRLTHAGKTLALLLYEGLSNTGIQGGEALSRYTELVYRHGYKPAEFFDMFPAQTREIHRNALEYLEGVLVTLKAATDDPSYSTMDFVENIAPAAG